MHMTHTHCIHTHMSTYMNMHTYMKTSCTHCIYMHTHWPCLQAHTLKILLSDNLPIPLPNSAAVACSSSCYHTYPLGSQCSPKSLVNQAWQRSPSPKELKCPHCLWTECNRGPVYSVVSGVSTAPGQCRPDSLLDQVARLSPGDRCHVVAGEHSRDPGF